MSRVRFLIDDVRAANRAAYRANLAAAGAARVVLLGNGEETGVNRMLVHPSTREPGRYQLSWIAADGTPCGHATLDTRDDAIASASGTPIGGEPAHGDRSFTVLEAR